MRLVMKSMSKTRVRIFGTVGSSYISEPVWNVPACHANGRLFVVSTIIYSPYVCMVDSSANKKTTQDKSSRGRHRRSKIYGTLRRNCMSISKYRGDFSYNMIDDTISKMKKINTINFHQERIYSGFFNCVLHIGFLSW